MNEVQERKRGNQLNYRDWDFKARYKKVRGIYYNNDFNLDIWIDYILQCVNHYAELYEIGYNRGFIEMGEEGGISDVVARESNGRIWDI